MAVHYLKLASYDLSQAHKRISYSEVATTDHYRKVRPYKLLHCPGRSHVDIKFDVPRNADMKDIAIWLNHCRTSAHGRVDILINNIPYKSNYGEAKWENFESQAFHFQQSQYQYGENVLRIRLSEGSPGVYWLSDVGVYANIDSPETDIAEVSRELVLNLNKYIPKREESIKDIRKIASQLDALHTHVEEAKVAGSAVSTLGWVLIGGAALLEVVSAGMATPIAAAMADGGLILTVGGQVTTAVSDVVEEWDKSSEVKQAEQVYHDDHQNFKRVQEVLQNMKLRSEKYGPIFKEKYPSLREANSSQLMTAVLLRRMVSGIMTIKPTEFSENVAKIPTILEEGFSKTLSGIGKVFGPAIGLVTSIHELVVNATKLENGSPSKAAKRLRDGADKLENDLQGLKDMLNFLCKSLLQKFGTMLAEGNVEEIANMIADMPIVDGYGGRFDFIDALIDPDIAPYIRENFIKDVILALYVELQSIVDEASNNRTSFDDFDLAIVAHGSIGSPLEPPMIPFPLPAVSHPRMFFGTEALSDVVFYSPWGVQVDAKVNYAILQAVAMPENRTFFSGQRTVTIPGLPPHLFNVVDRETTELIPTVWINSIRNDDQPMAILQRLLHPSGIVRPTERKYIWYQYGHGSIPLFTFTCAAALVTTAMGMLNPDTDPKISIHFAACLGAASHDDERSLYGIQQYCNAVSLAAIIGTPVWMSMIDY